MSPAVSPAPLMLAQPPLFPVTLENSHLILEDSREVGPRER